MKLLGGKMHNRLNRILFIGAFLIGLACAISAQCINIPFAPCKLYETADIVLIGTVKEISYSDPFDEIDRLTKKRLRNKIVLLTIKESFKGIAEKQTEITITISQIQRRSQSGDLAFERYVYANCPFDEFAQDEAYLVYAKRESAERKSIFLSDHAILITEAEPAITYLRKRKADHQTATLYGKIVRKVKGYGFGFPEVTERPIRNLKVEIQSEKQTFITTTDDQGNYLFSDIPPDEYSIKSDVPERLEVENAIRKISLSAKFCNEHNIVALTTGQISGAVFSHDGKPKGVEIELVVASEINNRKPRTFLTTSDYQSGKFEFKNIPPAQYILGQGLGKICDRKIYGAGKRLHSAGGETYCQPRTYYPGVADVSQARLITLTEGEQLKDLDFRLLPTLSERTISGIVVTPDGKPVANATIVLMVTQKEFNESGGITKTDESGRFSLPAYNDLKYWINANIKIKGADKHSEPIELSTNGDINGIKLVVSSSSKFCSLCYNKYWKRKGTPPQ